ncbi:MAG: phospholipase D-like domain-containing protein, partial [Blautia producta]
NLADEYINQKVRFGHWKDTAVRLTGKAVERFTYMFLEMWDVTEVDEEAYAKYKTPKEFSMPNDGFIMPYEVSPYGKERVGKKVYLDILNTAREYVHIMTPYLILDYEMIMALTYAAKRGVDVSIIMPHIPDKKYAFAVAKTYYKELLEAGVQIFEYEPGFVHAKVFVSDHVKAVVGTINLDYRSLFHHFECAALLYENSRIADIEEDFQNTLKKCIKARPSDYKEQPFYMRAMGTILRIFAPLM